MQPYTAGAECAGLAEDVTLGDVTSPRRTTASARRQARRLRRLHAERRAAHRRRHGRAGQPGAGQLQPAAVPRQRDHRLPHADAAPERQSGSAARPPARGRELRPRAVHQLRVRARSGARVQRHAGRGAAGRRRPQRQRGRRAARRGRDRRRPATSSGSSASRPRSHWTGRESSRAVPGGVESVALGDLDRDDDLDVVVGRPINSVAARENSIHYYKLNPSGSGGLEQVPTAAPVDTGRRSRRGRRRRRGRLQRRGRRRRLRDRDGPPRRRRAAASTAAATSRSSGTRTRGPPRA